MREFVAVDVSDGAAERPGAAPAHLTLCFLGEVPPGRNASIASRLRTVAEQSSPFRLRLEGVGTFPSLARPRVVWIGVTLGRDELVELAGRVRVALEPEVGPATEAFVPHLTLFRVRSSGERRAAAELLAGVRPSPPPREVAIDELLLKESVLRSSGAAHRTIEAFPLGLRSTGQPPAPSPPDATSERQR